MRRSLVIGLVLFGLALLIIGGPSLFVSPSMSDITPEETETPEIVTFEHADSGIWAFMNSQQSFEERSPINVIVYSDSEEVVGLLSEEGDGEWEAIDDEHHDAEPDTYSFLAEEQHHATGTEWGEAAGTTRYAWVDPGPDEDGYWVTETLQLDNGDYYGDRTHIRLYEAPNDGDQWVAMQGHTEHFDWFTLRHRVDGVEAAQSQIERDFMDLPQVDPQSDVSRIYVDNAGPSDADGWATVVDLVGFMLAPLIVGLTVSNRLSARMSRAMNTHLTSVDRARFAAAFNRIERRHLLLAATIIGLFIGVRIGGIVLERTAPFLTMHMIAALLYPVLALGLPIATYMIAGGLERRMDAAVTASLALAVAIWIDYAIVNVDSLPLDVIVQRVVVVTTLGLIAGGAAKRAARESRWNELVLAGAVLWIVVLTGTLLGYF